MLHFLDLVVEKIQLLQLQEILHRIQALDFVSRAAEVSEVSQLSDGRQILNLIVVEAKHYEAFEVLHPFERRDLVVPEEEHLDAGQNRQELHTLDHPEAEVELGHSFREAGHKRSRELAANEVHFIGNRAELHADGYAFFEGKVLESLKVDELGKFLLQGSFLDLDLEDVDRFSASLKVGDLRILAEDVFEAVELSSDHLGLLVGLEVVDVRGVPQEVDVLVLVLVEVVPQLLVADGLLLKSAVEVYRIKQAVIHLLLPVGLKIDLAVPQLSLDGDLVESLVCYLPVFDPRNDQVDGDLLQILLLQVVLRNHPVEHQLLFEVPLADEEANLRERLGQVGVLLEVSDQGLEALLLKDKILAVVSLEVLEVALAAVGVVAALALDVREAGVGDFEKVAA
jgi:hypothetical protein